MIYRYNHPAPPGKNNTPLASDGFKSAPLWMLWLARAQWRDSGAIPHRKDIAKLERAWVDDIYLLDDMIERAKPQQQSGGEPPLDNYW